jgi:hypothetical protein
MKTRFLRAAALSLALAAVAAPAAAARPEYIPRPAQATGSVDLRSPDARDAARGIAAHRSFTPAGTSTSSGTDWGDVGIVGGSVLGGLTLLGLGVALVNRRKDGADEARAAALSR